MQEETGGWNAKQGISTANELARAVEQKICLHGNAARKK